MEILPAIKERKMNMSNENQVDQVALPEEMEFNLSDFALFLSVMKDETAHECMLSIITDDPNLKLKQVHVEQVVLNRSGKRAIRLDAWAVDYQNRHYATEMQNDTDSDDMRKRSRYYQGLLDTPILKSGKNTRYKGLPATLITFITQDDIFKQDLAKYTFTEQCEEIAGLHLEDGTTKIFLNMTSKNGDPALVSMLQYMKKSDLNNPEIIVKDERIRKIDAVVTEVKESEEWEEVKMSILSYGIAQGREQGLAQGREQGIEVGIRALIKDNLDTGTGEAQIIEKLINLFSITPAQAKAYYDQFKSE
jgi:predicted transposase/invertase (TIGR01784 family)